MAQTTVSIRMDDHLKKQVEWYCNEFGITTAKVMITSAKKKLGGFILSPGELKICLPYRIMVFPDELIDYIIKHLLLLSVSKKRNENFYSLLVKYVPDYHVKEQQISQFNREFFNI